MKELSVTMQPQRTYLPAAGKDSLLPLYDVMTRLMGADKARLELLERAKIRPGHRVLEVGCGTGSLLIQLKRLCPDTEVVGLDPDPKALARARRKAARAAGRADPVAQLRERPSTQPCSPLPSQSQGLHRCRRSSGHANQLRDRPFHE